MAVEEEQKGNLEEADKLYMKALDIQPSHVHELTKVLKERKIDFIIAPYEADAQLACMLLSYEVDAILTRDTDLIVYGCPQVLFNLESSGACRLFESHMLYDDAVFGGGLSIDMVREICIFSGCDYIKPLYGMKILIARDLIREHGDYINIA